MKLKKNLMTIMIVHVYELLLLCYLNISDYSNKTHMWFIPVTLENLTQLPVTWGIMEPAMWAI